MIGAWAVTVASWAMYERLVIEVKPPFGRWTPTASTSDWLAQWTGDELRATLCTLDQEPVMGATTSWPAGYRPSFQRQARFDGSSFSMGPVTETVGLHDDDGDGNPGVSRTVAHPRIGEGKVFVRQTATMSWVGQARPNGTIAGRLDYAEHTLLGATTWWLRLPMPQRTAPGSTFELVPLAEGAGCDAVRR